MAEESPPVYGRRPDGTFELVPDADADLRDPEWPVLLIDSVGARAYARWLAERTGLPWRLPGELEWEKAARGVDGRAFPWGNQFDPSFSCMGASHAGPRAPQQVGSFPTDTSVYGVRGLAGNLRDWCADLIDDGPGVRDGRVVPSVGLVPGEGQMVATRGGAWTHTEREARAASRGVTHPRVRTVSLGFRVVRSVC
jgi:serine/threonine-protein kinase